jgi:hypothetical protein
MGGMNANGWSLYRITSSTRTLCDIDVFSTRGVVFYRETVYSQYVVSSSLMKDACVKVDAGDLQADSERATPACEAFLIDGCTPGRGLSWSRFNAPLKPHTCRSECTSAAFFDFVQQYRVSSFARRVLRVVYDYVI